MSVSTRRASHSAAANQSEPAAGEDAPLPAEPRVYGRPFWFAYVSNASVMVAVTLLFRYANFVTFLGGSEFHLGWIVGIGMVGSLLMRLFQGAGIDRYGARQIWLWSLGFLSASIFAHLFITRVDTPTIYLLRIAYSTSLAGVFGASITAISRRMPVARMAEVIGLLGTSGFVAMALGPALGDLLVNATNPQRADLDRMFLIAGGLCLVALVTAAAATDGEARPQRRRRVPMLWLIRRYHPGPLLLMSMAMGIGVTLPPTFLPAFAAERQIDNISSYFVMYACVAFLSRVLSRNVPARFGTRPMIFWGMSALVASLLSYLLVSSTWHFIVPAFFGGVAHALIFPAVIASGSGAFPNRYRGLGTTVMLAMLDLGTLVGAPLVGSILRYCKTAGLPAYPTMFVIMAVGLTSITAYFGIVSRGKNSPA